MQATHGGLKAVDCWFLTPYDVAARDEPESRSVCLLRGRHPYPLVSALVYDSVMFFINDFTLPMTHGERPCGLAFTWKQLQDSGLHSCDVGSHEARVQLEEPVVSAAAVFQEVDAIEATEPSENNEFSTLASTSVCLQRL